MQILINEKKEIISFALVGGVSGGVVVDDKLADKFTAGFKPKKYIFKDNDIKENVNFAEVTHIKSEQKTIIDALAVSLVNTQSKVDELKTANGKLSENQDMIAFQLAQIQLGGIIL